MATLPGSTNANVTQSKSGSRLSINIAGFGPVAFASSYNLSIDNTLNDIDVLDQLDVAEFAETAHKVNGSINRFKIDDDAANQLGIDPSNLDALFSRGDLSIDIIDRITGNSVSSLIGVKFSGGSGSVDARGVWTGSWNFKAKRSSQGSNI